jgi:hypothetical protein
MFRTRLHSCAQLIIGDWVKAESRGTAPFQGQVVEIHQPMDLFWAVDFIGERRILDFESHSIYLIESEERWQRGGLLGLGDMPPAGP